MHKTEQGWTPSFCHWTKNSNPVWPAYLSSGLSPDSLAFWADFPQTPELLGLHSVSLWAKSPFAWGSDPYWTGSSSFLWSWHLFGYYLDWVWIVGGNKNIVRQSVNFIIISNRSFTKNYWILMSGEEHRWLIKTVYKDKSVRTLINSLSYLFPNVFYLTQGFFSWI